MFASRLLLVLAAVAVIAAFALSAPRPTSGAAGTTHYVVQPGDTLWAVASAHYDGDPREAIWRIRERNGLESTLLRPGQVLYMPP
jgi:nucleoid-associated protein YgaU